MKILVAIKRVIDPDARIRLNADSSGVEEESVEYKVNPFCENAIEEALVLQGAHGGEVVLTSDIEGRYADGVASVERRSATLRCVASTGSKPQGDASAFSSAPLFAAAVSLSSVASSPSLAAGNVSILLLIVTRTEMRFVN